MALEKTLKVAKKTSSSSVAQEKKTKSKNIPLAHGVGRRKSSVARVWLRRGSGTITVNGMHHEQYFDTSNARMHAQQSLMCIQNASKIYDVEVNVKGGGFTGQAGAINVAVARALVANDTTDQLKKILREHGFMTVDSRLKERKKYGKKAARRSFQFVKR